MSTVQQSALSGLRVLDFGQYLAGPLVAMFLADYGADVIHVDPPEGPRWNDHTNAALYRGKRVVRLDLKTEFGRSEARRLIEDADVVIENFRSGVMTKLGLSPESFRGRNPGLVWCSMPGFSADDPRADIKAWEGVVMSAAGLFPSHGFGEGRPVFTALPLASNFAAFITLHRVAGAVLGRLQHGKGQHIEVPLFEACFEAIGQHAELPESRDIPRQLLGRLMPIMQPRQAADGKFVFLDNPYRGIQAFINRFLPGYDLLDLDDTDVARLASDLDRLFLQKTAAEWERIGQEELNSSLGLVQSSQDWLDDKHALDSQTVISVDDPLLGATRQPGYPVALSATPGKVRCPRRSDVSGDQRMDWLAERRHDPPIKRAGLPLDGVRVLDCSSLLAGPTATRILAQYGAEVIKVDKAGIVDEQPDPLTDDIAALCGARTVSAGKRMVFVDLQHPGGREILDSMLATVDVVHHNFTPSAAQRLGLSVDHIRDRNADAIVSTMSLHSPGGPRAQYRGHDFIGQMITGMGTRLGGGAGPLLASILVNDHSAGHLHAFGIMLALLHRHRTGVPQRVNCSLSGTATMHQFPFLVGYTGRIWDEPSGPDASGWHALNRLYQAHDGWIYVAHPDFAAARTLLGSAVGPLAGTQDINDDDLAEWLQSRFQGLPATACVEALRAAGLGAHRFVDLVELYTDDHVRRRNLIAVVDHPGIGRALGIGCALLGSPDSSSEVLLASRRPGLDTLDVVTELGFGARIEEFLRDKAISIGENPDFNRTTVAGYWTARVNRKPLWDDHRIRPVLRAIETANAAPSYDPPINHQSPWGADGPPLFADAPSVQ